MNVAVRVGVRRACRHQSELDEDVRIFGESDGRTDRGRQFIILGALHPAHVVHDQSKAAGGARAILPISACKVGALSITGMFNRSAAGQNQSAVPSVTQGRSHS